MDVAPKCFAGADIDSSREALLKLAAEGDVPTQRIAAVCLGRLTMGTEDTNVIQFLKDLCNEKGKPVQSAALKGLAMAAKSTCDEDLRVLCLDHARHPETAAAAIGALGMGFLGSGRSDVFADLAAVEQHHRGLPVRGRRHCKPLSACYPAVGKVYLGTGSEEPLEFLLDVLSRPGSPRASTYHWEAARALVMIEFPESVLGTSFLELYES